MALQSQSLHSFTHFYRLRLLEYFLFTYKVSICLEHFVTALLEYTYIFIKGVKSGLEALTPLSVVNGILCICMLKHETIWYL